MAQPEPRDAELVEQIVEAIRGLIWAVECRQPEQVAAEMATLMGAVLKYHATIGERPGDEPLRQAIERLNTGVAITTRRHPRGSG